MVFITKVIDNRVIQSFWTCIILLHGRVTWPHQNSWCTSTYPLLLYWCLGHCEYITLNIVIDHSSLVSGLTVFRGIQAVDMDKPNTPNSEIVYSLTGGNSGNKFSLEMQGHRPALVLKKPLDYDTGDTDFKLIVTASVSSHFLWIFFHFLFTFSSSFLLELNAFFEERR